MRVFCVVEVCFFFLVVLIRTMSHKRWPGVVRVAPTHPTMNGLLCLIMCVGVGVCACVFVCPFPKTHVWTKGVRALVQHRSYTERALTKKCLRPSFRQYTEIGKLIFV